MNQLKTEAIVLRSNDKGESDKLVRLLSSDGQLISCVLKGVKKQAAKLKFGAQPFAFCEYVMAGKGMFATVTACNSLFDFYELSQNSTKYLCGCVMLESAEVAAAAPNADVFLCLIKALKTLCYTEINPNLVTAHFYMQLLKALGYYEDYGVYQGAQIKNIGSVLKYLASCPSELTEGVQISDEICFKALKMLAGKFTMRIDCAIKSLKFVHI